MSDTVDDNESIVMVLNSANATSSTLSAGYAQFLLDSQLRFDYPPKIAVNTFSFTNFFYNISAALGNNELHVTDGATTTPFTLTIPDGGYSIENLNTIVAGLLTDAGHSGAFEILPNYSANKAYIQFGTVVGGYSLLFDAGTPYTLMGAVLNEKLPAGAGVYSIDNQQVYFSTAAAFNNIETININTNLSNNFIYGTSNSAVLYSTAPSVSVGSVQVDRPINLLWSNSQALVGGVNDIIIKLTDQTGAPLPMQENWMIILQIKTAKA